MMEDKTIMEVILNFSKNLSDLLMHGAIESKDDKLNKLYKESLTKCLSAQHEIFSAMEKSGWYKLENVSEAKINKVKNKYSAN